MTLGYVLRRCGTLVVVVWLALTVNFVLPRVATPDVSQPRGEVAHALLLDRPLWDQYRVYIFNLLRGDLNYSTSSYPSRVTTLIGGALPWTVALLGTTSVFAWALGTCLGAALALPARPRIAKYLFPPLMALGAAPYFIIAMLLLYGLAFKTQWFPLGGGYEAGTFPELSPGFILNLLDHAVLPSLSVLLASIATWSISMRALVVSLNGEDFMIFAEAKGLRRATVFVRYAMRNALPPQLTGLGLALGQIVSGGLLVEAVFRYPGLGGLLYRAILTRDYFLEEGIVLVVIVSIGLATFALELAYPLLDPRLRAGARP